MAHDTDQEKFEAILSAFESLERKLDAVLERLPVIDRTDLELAERLFPALAGSIGSEKFAATEALECAGVRAVVGRMNSITLGQLLARLERKTIAGYRIYRHTVGRRATLWNIVKVID